MKKILVIGGSGFIGLNLVSNLILSDKNVYITVVDKYINSELNNYERVDIFECSAGECGEFLNLKEYDEIYYLAASVGVRKVVFNPKEVLDNNILELYKFLNSPTLDIETPFLFTSSSEVYGNSHNTSENAPLVIDSSNLRWSYACSKLTSEFIVRSRMKNSIITRLFNIIGPYQNHETGMVFPSFIFSASKNLPLNIYNGGYQTRSFCYVSDCVNIMKILMNDPDNYNQIFNIGNDQNVITIKDLALLIKEKLSSSSEIKYTDFIEENNLTDKIEKNNYSDIRLRIPDIKKIKSVIDKNFEFTPLTDIIKFTYETGKF